MIIYKITNLINGRFYVGQDKYNNPNYYGSGKILKQAINKYGKENFIKEILEYCSSKEHLNEREVYWINFLNARERGVGYNITKGGLGGDTFTGNPDSDKTRKKISNSKKGRKGVIFTEEAKRKISEGNKGKEISIDVREKTSITMKKLMNSEAGTILKENLSKKLTGINRSEETKEKIRLSKTGDKNPMSKEENRAKLRGKKMSEESKEKNRQAHIGKKLTEEHKNKIRESMLKKKNPH